MEAEYELNEHHKEEFPPAHTAEHLLNQTMVRFFGCERSRNAHIERRKSKINYFIDHKPNKNEIKNIENKMNELIKDGIIEFAPLAFMRGRTFSNCMVILDESQNTTVSQMKMFLTRLGENCTMVVDGDLAQSDLKHQTNGLQWIYKRFQNIDDQISTVEFTKKDIVRHPLIEKMLIAFEDETFEPVSISKLPSGKEKEITADDMGGMKSADFSNLQKELGLLQEEKPTRFPNLFDMFKKS
jgi:hypothetical protein